MDAADDLRSPTPPGPGRFVVFEGGEAAGKSTQAARLAGRLGAVLTREPGGTAVGAALRALLLDPATAGLDDRAEALLMAADRAQHVAAGRAAGAGGRAPRRVRPLRGLVAGLPGVRAGAGRRRGPRGCPPGPPAGCGPTPSSCSTSGTGEAPGRRHERPDRHGGGGRRLPPPGERRLPRPGRAPSPTAGWSSTPASTPTRSRPRCGRPWSTASPTWPAVLGPGAGRDRPVAPSPEARS